jgi:hypothetical protein
MHSAFNVLDDIKTGLAGPDQASDLWQITIQPQRNPEKDGRGNAHPALRSPS